MRKLVLKIRRNTKAIVMGLALLGVMGLTHSKAAGATSFAFIGMVATMKKNKSWDGLDDNTKAFAEASDTMLKEFAKDLLTPEALEEKMKEFGKGLNEEQMNSFKEMQESVKKQAVEIQKMKDAGFESMDVLPFSMALKKALTENKAAIAAVKGNAKQGAEFSFKAASIMGEGTNITGAAQPYMPNPQIVQGLNAAPRNQPFILDFCDTGSTSSSLIVWFNKINRENGTAFIAEGVVKPLSDFEIDSETSQAKKIATSFNISEEMLSDIPFMESEIRKEGVENLMLIMEDGIINGDGTGANLLGILAHATGYSLPSLDDSTERANEYDALLAAHTQLTTLNYMPNLIAVHPTTRYKLRTMKDEQGRYLIMPAADAAVTNIDGLPMIAKNQIAPDHFLMADMSKIKVRSLMDVTVRVGYSDDDFKKNRVTFLVEARLHMYVSAVDEAAIIYDSFDTVKASLEAPTV